MTMTYKKIVILCKCEIKIIKENYAFLNLSDNEFNNVVKKSIESLILSNELINSKCKECVLKSLKIEFDKIVIQRLNSKNIHLVCESFINLNFVNGKAMINENYAVFLEFLNSYNIVLTIDSFLYLFKKSKKIKSLTYDVFNLNSFPEYLKDSNYFIIEKAFYREEENENVLVENEEDKVNKRNTIYQDLCQYSEELIQDFIENCSEYEKGIILKRYGTDLNESYLNEGLPNKKAKEFTKKIKVGMGSFYKNKNVIVEEKTDTNEKVLKIAPKTQSKRGRKKSLFRTTNVYREFSKFDKDLIDEVLNELLNSKYKESVIKKYGEDFEKDYHFYCETHSDEKLMKNVHYHILRRLNERINGEYLKKKEKKESRRKTEERYYNAFTDFPKIDEKVLTIVLSGLLKTRHGEKVIFRYGSDFKEKLPLSQVKCEEQKHNKINLINLVNRYTKLYLSNPEEFEKSLSLKRNITTYNAFSDFPNIDEEILTMILNGILKTKYKDKVILRYGDDFTIKKDVKRIKTPEQKNNWKSLKALVYRLFEKHLINNERENSLEKLPKKPEDNDNFLNSGDMCQKEDFKKSTNIKIQYAETALLSILENLDEFNRKIVSLTVGYPSGIIYSFEETAQIMNVSQKDVVKITQSVLKELNQIINKSIEDSLKEIDRHLLERKNKR